MRVALGVTGGVAAYKAAELVRRLQQDGLEVEVIMTRHAQEFITPLTFAALTGRKVITEMFSADDFAPANVESAIEHIAVAQRIDALVIAPATANSIAKLAQGLANDFLSTLRPGHDCSGNCCARDERQHVGTSRYTIKFGNFARAPRANCRAG